ncbi:Lrp/AsnC family transcriptional regulator [Clostridiisalibacter paucivorans]|uniref:Lrp/AsnC family transcriptional regulator n=1 Tax=Clostridiisalibacter paucivorans TaxID=408753 RepID=UPI000478842F|nr:Lrp/AsnC family transcriptional regulator [Clostridiisalibacter paucivorans]
MDNTDWDIIKILQTQGRIPMKELGKMVALTPPAAAERVKKLEEKGIIAGYKAIIDPNELNRTINAFINVDMKVEKHEKFKEFVNNNKYVTQCYHVTGPYCMIIKARFDKMSALEEFIGQVQVFGNTETFIILSSPVEDKILEPIK